MNLFRVIKFSNKRQPLSLTGLFLSVLISFPAFTSDRYLEAHEKNVRKHLGEIVKDWSLQYAEDNGVSLEWYDLAARSKEMRKQVYQDKKLIQCQSYIEYTGQEKRESKPDVLFFSWVHNNTDEEQSLTINQTERTDDVISFILEEPINLGILASATTAFPRKESGSMPHIEVEFSEDGEYTKTITQRWEAGARREIPAKTSRQLILTLILEELTLPFVFTTEVQGFFAIKLTGYGFKKSKRIKIFPISKVFEKKSYTGYEDMGGKFRIQINGEAKVRYLTCNHIKLFDYPFLDCTDGQEEKYLKNNPQISGNLYSYLTRSEPKIQDGNFVNSSVREYGYKACDSKSDEDLTVELYENPVPINSGKYDNQTSLKKVNLQSPDWEIIREFTPLYSNDELIYSGTISPLSKEHDIESIIFSTGKVNGNEIQIYYRGKDAETIYNTLNGWFSSNSLIPSFTSCANIIREVNRSIFKSIKGNEGKVLKEFYIMKLIPDPVIDTIIDLLEIAEFRSAPRFTEINHH